jgi:hypothetical protein
MSGATLSPILQRQKLAKADWLDSWSSRRRDFPSNCVCGMWRGRNLWNNLFILNTHLETSAELGGAYLFFFTLKDNFVNL